MKPTRRSMSWRLACALTLASLLLTPSACERGSESGAGSTAGRTLQRGDPLIADADALLERARRVEIVSIHARTTLERGDAPRDWRVLEFGDYPADWDFVVYATRGLAMVRVLEARTGRADRHAMLGLVDPREVIARNTAPPEAQGAGMLIRWLDERGEELAAVVLGDQADDSGIRRSGRLAGSAQSWLIEGQTPISASPTAFINAMLSTLPRGRVGGVTIRRPGWSVEIARREWREDARLLTPPPPARLNDGAADALLDGLAFVQMLEVRRTSDAPVNSDPAAMATYRLFEGASVTIDFYEPEGAGGVVWATARAEPAPVIGDDAFPHPERLEAWLQRETSRWEGWAFRVPREAVMMFLGERGALVRE